MMRTGDERFEALYRKYYGRVYRFFRSSLSDDQDAQDHAQETFKRIYETFAQYRGESEWSFIQTTAQNLLFNTIRARNTKKRKGDMVDLDDLRDGPPAPPEIDLADRQEAEMRRARLWAAIAELPEGQRQCMELWLSEIAYEPIAATLGITIDAVKSRLRDARKALRARLGESLPEDEA